MVYKIKAKFVDEAARKVGAELTFNAKVTVASTWDEPVVISMLLHAVTLKAQSLNGKLMVLKGYIIRQNTDILYTLETKE